ncbi:MAG: DUF808 domain-containing protein [Paracoccaceae bacterium]
MSVGLLALLDDVAALARATAASLDDIAMHTARAGGKTAGVVIDDAAVAPGYLAGLPAERELPIVWRIAVGSLRNKLFYLLPAALLLGTLAPWLVTPLLMLGGAYLAYEGAEKVLHAVMPHEAEAHEARAGKPRDAKAMEEERVSSAIRTDFILSAEIMAITLASVAQESFLTKAVVLGVVGTLITLVVYGAVALLVRADDFGLRLAQREGASESVRAFGRFLVRSAVPWIMWGLTVIGTAAMVWVGGGIILHGLAEFGLAGPEHWLEDVAHAVAGALPLGGVFGWLVQAAGAGLVGLALGLGLIPLVGRVIAPAWEVARGRLGRA